MNLSPILINWRFPLTFVLIVCCVAMYRTAWIADDSIITLRSVLNFIHGYGPIFHVNERVQSFTHTSWFFLLTAVTLITGTPYLAIITSGFLVNLATLGVIVHQFGKGAIYLICVLLFSKAFMDFANSGLENPLTFLLLALLIPLTAIDDTDTPRKWILAGLYCGLLILTRPDLGLMLIAITAAFFRRPGFAWIAIGLLPLFMWEAFSLFYYGSLIPNTALAKLNTGLPQSELVLQGLLHLIQTAVYDPLTILIIIFFLYLSFYRKSKRFVAAFVLSYVAYTVWVGGDFMGGRFLTPPFFASLIGLAMLLREQPLQPTWERRSAWAMILSGIPVIYLKLIQLDTNIIGETGYFAKAITFTSPSWVSLLGLAMLLRQQKFPKLLKKKSNYLLFIFVFLPVLYLELLPNPKRIHFMHGIADERLWYWDAKYDLADHSLYGLPPIPEWSVEETYPRDVLVACGGLGGISLRAGPSVHVIDVCGLSDPLLARLPLTYIPYWRIGHFERDVPHGYLESIRGEDVAITPSSVAALHADLKIALSAPLLEPTRVGAIWRLHTKDYGVASAAEVDGLSLTTRLKNRFTCLLVTREGLINC